MWITKYATYTEELQGVCVCALVSLVHIVGVSCIPVFCETFLAAHNCLTNTLRRVVCV